MKKVILAINDKKIEEQITKSNKVELVYNNLQYREAILEILEMRKKVDSILISESLPGIISIEELLKKIKLINNKINIIFFLEKKDSKKEHKLKKLKIKYIYSSKKINIKYILSLIENGNENKNVSNNEKDRKGKLIVVTGQKKTGKTTITMLLAKYLLGKNKKILLININKEIEREYFIIFKNKYNENTNKRINNKNIIGKYEIKIADNLFFMRDFQERIKKNDYSKSLKYFRMKYTKKYDYILFDISNDVNKRVREEIVNISDNGVIVISNDLKGLQTLHRIKYKLDESGIKEIKKLIIIINKYYLNSIGNAIFKNLVKGKIKFCTIYYRKKYKDNYKKIKFSISKKIFQLL